MSTSQIVRSSQVAGASPGTVRIYNSVAEAQLLGRSDLLAAVDLDRPAWWTSSAGKLAGAVNVKTGAALTLAGTASGDLMAVAAADDSRPLLRASGTWNSMLSALNLPTSFSVLIIGKSDATTNNDYWMTSDDASNPVAVGSDSNGKMCIFSNVTGPVVSRSGSAVVSAGSLFLMFAQYDGVNHIANGWFNGSHVINAASLAAPTHTTKTIRFLGKHVGGVPTGYLSCAYVFTGLDAGLEPLSRAFAKARFPTALSGITAP